MSIGYGGNGTRMIEDKTLRVGLLVPCVG